MLINVLRRVATEMLGKKHLSQASIPAMEYQRGGKIVAILPPSEGDALKQHTLEMLKPLDGLSSKLEIVHIDNHDWIERILDIAHEPIWFAISPFGCGENILLDGERLFNPWSMANIPFVRLYGDLPAYYPAGHIQQFRNSINAYGHKEHQDEFMRWFPSKAPSVTLPLFPFDVVEKKTADIDKKLSSRLILFPKNGNSPSQLIDYWRRSLPPEISRALEATSETLHASLDTNWNLFDVLIDHFRNLSIEITANKRLLFFLAAQLDDFLRRKKSTLIANTLLDYPVTIRGAHWEHISFAGKKAKYDRNTDYSGTRQLIDDALAIVDMSPNTHSGAHDRTLRAAGRYTAFLTNRQGFFEKSFENHRDFLFSFTEEGIQNRIEFALSDPRKIVEMGLYQAERMRELLTVESYVKQLITVVDACALACSERPDGTQDFVHYKEFQL